MIAGPGGNTDVRIAATRSETLPEAANRWAALALELNWVEQWVEGAIFPCEMVYFLAMAEIEDSRTILESGRQDGYSTIILGEFARRTGIRVVSIDYEEEAERGQRCRERLASYPVEALVGDAFSLIGRILAESATDSVAILVDGPKGWSANALALSSAGYSNVRLLALHNQHLASPETRALLDVFHPRAFYEDALVETEGPWRQLREQEKAHLERNAVRPLDRSSLAAFIVSDASRHRIRNTLRREFMFFQPPLINLFWRLRWYEGARRLHSGSFRVFNSRLIRPFKRK